MSSFSFFISKRISGSEVEKGSFTSTISKVAIASITIGVAVMLLSILILEGFKDTIKDKIYSFTGHIVVSKYTHKNSLDDHISLDNKLYASRDSLDFIDRIEPYAIKAGLLKTKEDIQGVVIKGVDQNFGAEVFANNIIEGHMPEIIGSESDYSKDILISSYLAKLLRLGTGDDVFMYFAQTPPRYRKLKISGIYETGLEDFDTKVVIGDIGMIRRLNGWNDSIASAMQVFVKNPKQMERAYDDIFEVIGYDLFASRVQDKYLQIFDWLNLLNRNVVVLLTLILIIAVFNMVSILLILIMERTRMIGVLMALGASTRQIRSIFSFHGMLLTIKGIVYGNLLGLGLCALQDYFHIIPLEQESYYMSYVPVSWPVTTIVIINLFTFLLITVSLLLPALSISRVRPIEAIRFD